MISFTITFLGILAGTLIPVIVALYFVSAINIGNKNISVSRYTAALGLGILFWFYSDVMLDATQIGVNSGLSGGASQAGLVIAFVIGVLLLVWLDRLAFSRKGVVNVKQDASLSSFIFLIPIAVALGIGVHGLGEGADFATIAATTNSNSLIVAYGGYGPLISYVSHKFLEGVIVGASFSAYVIVYRRDQLKNWASLMVPLLVAIVVVPTLIGTTIGYYVLSFDPTYFFAFASGASIYIALRLVEPVLVSGWGAGYALSPISAKLVVAILIGFLLLYTAATFHSILISPG